MNRYVAKDGERLDQVVYANYKSLDVFNSIMEFNKHLQDKPILSAGDVVYLPEIEVKTKIKELKSLWN
jgi:phage tail protein X